MTSSSCRGRVSDNSHHQLGDVPGADRWGVSAGPAARLRYWPLGDGWHSMGGTRAAANRAAQLNHHQPRSPGWPWLAKQVKTTVALGGCCTCSSSSWEPGWRMVLLADHSHWRGHGQKRPVTIYSSSASNWSQHHPKTWTQARAPSWGIFIDARRHTEVHQLPVHPKQAASPCTQTLTLAPTAP